jgi:hypothetical protein
MEHASIYITYLQAVMLRHSKSAGDSNGVGKAQAFESIAPIFRLSGVRSNDSGEQAGRAQSLCFRITFSGELRENSYQAI